MSLYPNINDQDSNNEPSAPAIDIEDEVILIPVTEVLSSESKKVTSEDNKVKGGVESNGSESGNEDNGESSNYYTEVGNYFNRIKVKNVSEPFVSKILHLFYLVILIISLILFFTIEDNITSLFVFLGIVISILSSCYYSSNLIRSKTLIVYPNINFWKLICFIIIIVLTFVAIVLLHYKVTIWFIHYVNDGCFDIDYQSAECSFNDNVFYSEGNKYIGYGVLNVETVDKIYLFTYGLDDFLGFNKTKEELVNKYGTDDKEEQGNFSIDFKNKYYQHDVNVIYSECKINARHKAYSICIDEQGDIDDCISSNGDCENHILPILIVSIMVIDGALCAIVVILSAVIEKNRRYTKSAV